LSSTFTSFAPVAVPDPPTVEAGGGVDEGLLPLVCVEVAVALLRTALVEIVLIPYTGPREMECVFDFTL